MNEEHLKVMARITPELVRDVLIERSYGHSASFTHLTIGVGERISPDEPPWGLLKFIERKILHVMASMGPNVQEHRWGYITHYSFLTDEELAERKREDALRKETVIKVQDAAAVLAKVSMDVEVCEYSGDVSMKGHVFLKMAACLK